MTKCPHCGSEPSGAGVREALALSADVLKNVQEAYGCQESPLINMTLARIAAALALPQSPAPGEEKL